MGRMEQHSSTDAPSAPLKPDLLTDGAGVPVDLDSPQNGPEGGVGKVIVGAIQEKLDTNVPLAPAEKQRMAVTLRLSGATYKQIAQSLGLSVSYAHQLVTTALKDTAQDGVEDLRRMQYSRLEHMLMLIWPSVNQRDLSAMHTAMALMRDENQLMGVGLPEVMVGNNSGGPTSIIAAGDKDEYITALRQAREEQQALAAQPEGD